MATGERLLFSEQACCLRMPAAAAECASCRCYYPSAGLVTAFALIVSRPCAAGDYGLRVGIHRKQGAAELIEAHDAVPSFNPALTQSRMQACDGGLAEGAFDYIKDAGGIRLESDVPYRGASPGAGTACMSTLTVELITHLHGFCVDILMQLLHAVVCQPVYLQGVRRLHAGQDNFCADKNKASDNVQRYKFKVSIAQGHGNLCSSFLVILCHRQHSS